MELVPGQTLAERLATGALPVEEVLRICGQITEGVLEATRALELDPLALSLNAFSGDDVLLRTRVR
jgi:hypothetical protein